MLVGPFGPGDTSAQRSAASAAVDTVEPDGLRRLGRGDRRRDGVAARGCPVGTVGRELPAVGVRRRVRAMPTSTRLVPHLAPSSRPVGTVGRPAGRQPGPPLRRGDRLGVLRVLDVRPRSGRGPHDRPGPVARLYVRQFRAFDRAGVVEDFGVPEHWEVCTMSAIGRLPVRSPADEGEARPDSDRRPSGQLRWPEAATRVQGRDGGRRHAGLPTLHSCCRSGRPTRS